ncbi:MAG: type I restriction enzyme HsdR N-terminal domain-containing protein [Bacteroidota bacterium]
MIRLNLPEVEVKIREKEGNHEIFDVIRKKYIHLTPEEWVRQHFIHYLISHLDYPRSLIKVESELHYNQLKKRSDILTYSSSGVPFLLVECKSFKNPINQETLMQATTYNKTVNAPYLVLTNGLKHYSYAQQYGTYASLKEIPFYERKA